MHTDDRVVCKHCGKQMVPKIVMGPPTIRSATNWTAVPKYSVCPFCGNQHQRFNHDLHSSLKTVAVVVLVIGAVAFCNTRNTSEAEPESRQAASASAPAEAAPQLSDTPKATPEQTLANFEWQGEARVTRSPAVNAAPLGLEIGYANIEGVRKHYPDVVFRRVNDNPVSGGPAFRTNGDGLGVDNLYHAQLTFDAAGTLVDVSMTLPKDPRGALNKIASKYRVVANQIDSFLNYGNARLAKGDSVVEILSEHLSFEMDINYSAKSFSDASKQARRNEQAAKARQQANKL